MLASVYAARNGMEVHLFEQNEKLGKKLFITGKGRCNFTNGCATEELFESFITNPRFLYSAVYGYTNYDVIDFFETAGVKQRWSGVDGCSRCLIILQTSSGRWNSR